MASWSAAATSSPRCTRAASWPRCSAWRRPRLPSPPRPASPSRPRRWASRTGWAENEGTVPSFSLAANQDVEALRAADPEVRVAEDVPARVEAAAAAEVGDHAVVAVDLGDVVGERLDRARAGVVAGRSRVDAEDD